MRVSTRRRFSPLGEAVSQMMAGVPHAPLASSAQELPQTLNVVLSEDSANRDLTQMARSSVLQAHGAKLGRVDSSRTDFPPVQVVSTAQAMPLVLPTFSTCCLTQPAKFLQPWLELWSTHPAMVM